jgi:hypothetical protein
MHQLDERILEHLRESGWASPRTMHRHFRFTASEERIEERCQALANAGLVGPIYEGVSMYELTTPGKLYLNGDLNAENLPGWTVG